MRRPLRILLELTGPALFTILLLYGALFAVLAYESRASEIADLAHDFLRSAPFAFRLSALPSVLYAFAMELAFAMGLAPRSKKTIALAAALGALGGLGFQAMATGFDGGESFLPFFLVLGAISGSLVGVVILTAARIADRRAARAKPDLAAIF